MIVLILGLVALAFCVGVMVGLLLGSGEES